MQVEIVLTPAEIALLPARDLRGATCVVFDVLRATSTILTALSHGARRIYPVSTVAEALDLRLSMVGEALLGGERAGIRIDDFDLGNSPSEYRPETVGGRDIVMTTTNGTVALQGCSGADFVYAGALLNLDAQAAAIRRQIPSPERLCLVCAGSGTEFALEDGLAAAALLARLEATRPLTDAAMLLAGLLRSGGDTPLEILRASANGRRLQQIGLSEDVAYCAQISVLQTIAVLKAGALQLAVDMG